MKNVFIVIFAVIGMLHLSQGYLPAADDMRGIEPIPLKNVDVIDNTNGEVLVVGSIEVTVGVKQDLSGGQFHLLIKDINTNAYYDYTLMKYGAFYWHLPPGEYLLATLSGNVQCTKSRDPCGDHRIWAKFEVPDNAKAVYIGKLRAFRHLKNFFPKIENEFELAKKRAAKKFRGFNLPMDIYFMELEERL